MKKNLIVSIKLTLIMVLLCAVLFPLIIAAVGTLTPGAGKGVKVYANGKVVGYERLGQSFTEDKYFWGRPSAVDYNSAGSAGSNKGPSNPDYLKIVQDRIDSFLAHNPGIMKSDIPAELVTASGSGLDPDITPAAAYVQVKRIARSRRLKDEQVRNLIHSSIEPPLLGFFGVAKINVLRLNIALDNIK